MNKLLLTIIIVATLFLLPCYASANKRTNRSSHVNVVGKMKNVMWKGQLQGVINLDTIQNKNHLYGFGPQEYLNAELLIMNGKSYKSTVVNEKVMKVEETYESKAPFFAYANIEEWDLYALPDSVTNISTLENYLNQVSQKHIRPFLIKMEAPKPPPSPFSNPPPAPPPPPPPPPAKGETKNEKKPGGDGFFYRTQNHFYTPRYIFTYTFNHK
ncbi:MAG: alpha-acetolactate decarboxylase [Bacteroidetes bacterium]|nr:alpha-acetolactate decarboxylase [Bacteroidota bacterium]